MNKNYFDDHIDASNELVNLEQTKVIIAQQGTKLPLYQEYFSNLLKSGAEVVKTVGKGIQQQHANQAEALAVPGNAANWAMQKGMQALAKKTHGLTDDDMPKVGFESPSTTINKNFRQFDPLNFGQSLAVDMFLDPTTYVSGKAASKVIKKQLGDRTLKQVATEVADAVKNAKVIPTRKRILPKKFQVSSREFESPWRDEVSPKYETVLHDAKNPKHEYGSLTTTGKQARKGVGPNELIPDAIDVDPTVQGNRVQDMLYQEHLNFVKQNTPYNYIRTGDFLLSPEYTQKFWDRSIVQDIPGEVASHLSIAGDKRIPMNVKRYYGSQNPNITKEVMERISKLPKHEFKFKSWNEVTAQPKGQYLSRFDEPMKSLAKNTTEEAAKRTPGGIGSAAKQLLPLSNEALATAEDGIMQSFGRKNPQEALDKANKWMDDWVSHPATQQKVEQSMAPLRGEYPRYYESAIRYFRDYRPKAQFYSLKQQVKDLFNTAKGKHEPGFMNEHVHSDNRGVNYSHYRSMDQVLTGAEPPAYNPNRTGSYVSRTIPDAAKETVAVHELTHDMFKDNFMYNSRQKDIINSVIPLDVKKSENKFVKYLREPTEVHARIMQLRHHYNLKPDQYITRDMASSIINDASKKAKSKGYGHDVLRTIANDPDRLRILMNNLMKATAVGTGAAAIASQQND